MLEIIRERAQGVDCQNYPGPDYHSLRVMGGGFLHNMAVTRPTLSLKVDGQKITRQEFGQTLKEQQERMRAAMGERFDPSHHWIVRKSASPCWTDWFKQRLLAMESVMQDSICPIHCSPRLLPASRSSSRTASFPRLDMKPDAAPAKHDARHVFENRLRQESADTAAHRRYPMALPCRGASQKSDAMAEQQREISQAW